MRLVEVGHEVGHDASMAVKSRGRVRRQPEERDPTPRSAVAELRPGQ